MENVTFFKREVLCNVIDALMLLFLSMSINNQFKFKVVFQLNPAIDNLGFISLANQAHPNKENQETFCVYLVSYFQPFNASTLMTLYRSFVRPILKHAISLTP